ncbi:MAG TPA: tetratricopeptide repeat protein [Candidatus Acidoferrum sp.]|nr:tetratricopeptide repeat protein [Candidatus Acidoferrum sp.]
MSRLRLIALLLALVTLAVYLPVVNNGFILYDDGDYVTQNKMVRGGLTLAGVKWAFTTFSSANWHPLTWLSHMTDCELFGVNAAGSHVVNALFHAINTVLLFALWLQLTRRDSGQKDGGLPREPNGFWPGAFIAALFALHPLHVESVAWAAERKDVLSTFFGLLALLCYARYAANGKGRSQWYWLALLLFACGLMSKPMLVTLPFVMLLLDYWPLERFNRTGVKRLLVEKIPFFLLTIASCVVTYLAQKTGAVRSLAQVPLPYRFENAMVAVATYLLKMIWPTRLAVIYPMPHSIPAATFIVCLGILIFITVAVWLARKKNPFLLVGWFWFLGTLVPIIGLVKVGDAAMADRYTYIPSIGIFVAVAFGAQKNLARRVKFVLPTAAVFILIPLVLITERQLQFWRDDETLFKHAMDVTTNNVDAIINYGVALEDEGKPVKALAQYRRAEALGPSYLAHADVGNLLLYMGDTNGALEEFRQAVQLAPDLSTLHARLGKALVETGHFAEGTNEFFEAMRLAPSDPSPHVELGTALATHDDFAAATNQFSDAMGLTPGNPAPQVEWAKALLMQRRDAEAVKELQQALQLDPDNFQTLAFTARVQAADEHPEIRDGQTALTLAQKASALTGGAQPLVEDVLAMAQAEAGQFDAAQTTVSNAIQLATAAGMRAETIVGMQKRWQLYQKHQPWRESFLNETN